jgi:hypothetical protein
MGASPYSPLLGRFLSVDPIEGGSANDYVLADPINKTDLNGRSWFSSIVHSAVSWARSNPGIVHMVVRAVVGVAVGFGVCLARAARLLASPAWRSPGRSPAHWWAVLRMWQPLGRSMNPSPGVRLFVGRSARRSRVPWLPYVVPQP